MGLLLNHPGLATRNCDHCLKFVYDNTGNPVTTHKWDIENDGVPEEQQSTREYVPRDDSCPAPCRTAKGCPKGTPENPKTLNERNQRCYEHYLECRAVGQFPDDAVVRRNAALIRAMEDAAEKIGEERWKSLLFTVARMRGPRDV